MENTQNNFVNLTIRISYPVLEKLKDKAQKKKVSCNKFISSILTREIITEHRVINQDFVDRAKAIRDKAKKQADNNKLNLTLEEMEELIYEC